MFKKDESGNVIIGDDGHPIPEAQGVVEAVMAPVAHKRTSAGGGAVAEGVAIGTLIPDLESASPTKKGN